MGESKPWPQIILVVLIVLVMLSSVYRYSPKILSYSDTPSTSVTDLNVPTMSSQKSWQYPETLDWEKILHFIPNKADEDCLQLFTTASSKSIAQTSTPYKNFLQVLALLTGESERLKHLNHLPAPRHEKLSLTYQELAKQPWVERVCEIGFDQGQSAAAWLTAKDNLELHSFDIGLLKKSPYMAKLLKLKYKDRFTFHMGASDKIMPVWAQMMKGACDIISIDGAHDFQTVYTDFIHMRTMAKKRHLIIADDIEYPGVKEAWTLLTDLKIVSEQYRCHITGIDIDFVVGQYGQFYWDFN